MKSAGERLDASFVRSELLVLAALGCTAEREGAAGDC
jgi:hypothetical protein